MSFSDDAAAAFQMALEGPPAADGKAARRRMAAAAYEAAHARRAAGLGQQYRPGQVFNCALGMLDLGD
jgi:hypothetical protein